MGDSWHSTLMVYNYGDVQYKRNIAMFSFNNTLITGYAPTEEGYVWEFGFDSIPDKLREISETHNIIIYDVLLPATIPKKKTKPNYTHQTGSRDATKAVLDEFVKKLNIPLIAVFNQRYNCYHKPCTNVWKLIEKTYIVKTKLELDIKSSYYCGSLAGRGDSEASTDRAFASNAGINFFTPIELFCGAPATPYTWRPTRLGLEVRKKYIADCKEQKAVDIIGEIAKFTPNKNYMIIITGPPCSGKTTLAKRLVSEFKLVRSQPANIITGKVERLKTVCKSYIESEGLIVVDMNTFNAKLRKPYLDIANKHKVATLVLEIHIPRDICRILSFIRVQRAIDSPGIYFLNDKVFDDYERLLEPPEGDTFDIDPAVRKALYRNLTIPMLINPDVSEFWYHAA